MKTFNRLNKKQILYHPLSVLLATVLWIVIVNTAAYSISRQSTHVSREKIMFLEPQLFEQSLQNSRGFLSAHLRWDAFWYLHTAQHGYFVDYSEKLSNVAFFPLYPILINLAGTLINDYVLAGWLISNVCLLLFALLLFHYTFLFHSNINPWLPLLVLFTFPTAFFLTAIYTESLFLTLSLAVFYYSRQQNFTAATAFGLLASLTKPQGMLLVIPLAAEYFSIYGQAGLKRPNWLMFGSLPLVFLGYLVFLKIKFQDFFLLFQVQSWFMRQPLQLPRDLMPLIFGSALVIFMGFMIYFSWQRFHPSYSLYLIALMAMPLSSLSFMSLSRFYLVAMPIYFVLSSIKTSCLFYGWLLLSLSLLWNDITFFVQGRWAG